MKRNFLAIKNILLLAAVSVLFYSFNTCVAAQQVTATTSVFISTSTPQLTDTDGDKLSNYDEVTYFHTDPNYADTDGDGYPDNTEIYAGYNPLGAGRASTSTKRVEVDLTTQTLTYYYNNVALESFGVSTGLPIWRTPTGTFAVFKKKPVVNYTGANYSYPKTKWNLEFLPHFYLHGAYWHNQFGIRPMSHGCVNIAYKDVEKLYQFMDVGNQVKVIGKTPTKPIKQAVLSRN